MTMEMEYGTSINILMLGDYEYKFRMSNNVQEELTEGSDCTVTTDGMFINRFLTVIEGQALELEVVCWESCTACEE